MGWGGGVLRGGQQEFGWGAQEVLILVFLTSDTQIIATVLQSGKCLKFSLLALLHKTLLNMRVLLASLATITWSGCQPVSDPHSAKNMVHFSSYVRADVFNNVQTASENLQVRNQWSHHVTWRHTTWPDVTTRDLTSRYVTSRGQVTHSSVKTCKLESREKDNESWRARVCRVLRDYTRHMLRWFNVGNLLLRVCMS